MSVDPFSILEQLTSDIHKMADELERPLVDMVQQAYDLPEPLQGHAVVVIAPHLIDLRAAILRVAEQLDIALATLPTVKSETDVN